MEDQETPKPPPNSLNAESGWNFTTRLNPDETSYRKEIRIISCVFIGLLLWPCLRSFSTHNDLHIFFAAAQRMVSGENLYTQPYPTEGWSLYYYYSPLFASFLVPFTLLPQTEILENIPLGIAVLKLFWILLNGYIIFDLLQIFSGMLALPRHKKTVLFWWIMLAISFRWLFLNILAGQMTIFIVWGSLRVFQAPSKSPISRLWALALGINTKILSVFILGQLFLMRWWKGFLLAVLLSAVLLCIPYLYLPAAYHTELIQGWMANINPFSKSHIVEVGEGGFIDMGAIIAKYLTGIDVPGESRIGWGLISDRGVFILTQCFRILVLCSCWIWLLAIKKSNVTNKNMLITSVFLASIPLAFPHQRDYSLFMVWPMMALIVHAWFYDTLSLPVYLKCSLLLAGILLGNLVFFEALSEPIRLFVGGNRIQGIGALLLWVCMHIFLYLRLQQKIQMPSSP